MSNPFIKFGAGEIMISKDNITRESLGNLKNGSFKIEQNIDEIIGDNRSIVKIKAKSASISGEIENINLAIISYFQENYNFQELDGKKELTGNSESKNINNVKIKFVNESSTQKKFSIELFNGFLKDSLSIIFGRDKNSPTFKQQVEFIGFPDSTNNIFKITDEL